MCIFPMLSPSLASLQKSRVLSVYSLAVSIHHFSRSGGRCVTFRQFEDIDIHRTLAVMELSLDQQTPEVRFLYGSIGPGLLVVVEQCSLDMCAEPPKCAESYHGVFSSDFTTGV